MSNEVSEKDRVLVSLPLQDPFDIPDGIVVDLKSANFADDFNDNISTAFIYLRNIEYKGEIDFSGFTLDEKMQILKLYMTRDIKDFNIEQLDYTVIQLFIALSDKQNLSILNQEESWQFREKYSDICNELLQLLISLPLFILSLDKDVLACDMSEVEHITTMPQTYECMCALLQYQEINVFLFLPAAVEEDEEEIVFPKQVFFDKVFDYANAQLADKVQPLAFNLIYNGMLNDIADSQDVLPAEQ